MLIDDRLYITHHGVKGMKWGVRKQREKLTRAEKRERNTQAAKKAGYTQEQRKWDRRTTSARTVRRIEKKIASGKPVAKARKQAAHSRQRRAIATSATIIAAGKAYQHRESIKNVTMAALLVATHVVREEMAKQAAAEVFSRTRGISAANVVDLAYDAAAKTWR